MSFFKSFQNWCLLSGFLVFLIVVGIFSQARADVPDMMINSDGTSEIHNMSQIWVSPIDSNVVMIVWRDFRLGYRRVALGVSYDEGHTWFDSLLSRPNTASRHSDPIISGDRLGNFYPMTMVFDFSNEWYDFSLWKSADNGTTWSGPFLVLGDTTGYEEDKELLAIDRTGGIYDGNLYVVWTRFPNPTSMMFARSTTGGVSWEDPLVLASPDTSGLPAGYYACPVVDADGNVYVVWYGFYESRGDYHTCLKMAKSTDGGQSFTDPEIFLEINYVDEAPGQIKIYNLACMDADITNGPYRGNIYLAVPNGVDPEHNSPSDIVFVKSTDGGDSWSDPIRVNDDPEGPSVYQFHPWITVNQKGAIIVFFYDQRNDPPLYEKFDTYIAFSFDGGETFTTNYRVSDVSSDPDDALTLKEDVEPPEGRSPFISSLEAESSKGIMLCNYIGVAAYHDQVHCTWTDTRDGNQNVYYSNFGIPLLPPRLFLPEDEEHQLPPLTSFWWAACGYFDEVTYDVEISTDSTFTTIDFEYTDIDTNIFTVSKPLYPRVPILSAPKDSSTVSAYAPVFAWRKGTDGSEVEYFWRAKAYRIPDDTASEYSNVWSFNVDASAPLFYTLQVSDDSLFSPRSEFYEYTDIYDTSFTIPDTLLDSTLYYWRVKASDEAGHESSWQEHPFQFYALHFNYGDANNDSLINIADVVQILNYLFINGPPPVPCLEAGDANCDGVVNIADVVYLINYLFLDGPPPGC
jgi:hypothetical protein